MGTPQRRSFTLVELMTVIVIIMILIGILMPTIGFVIKKAEENQTKARIKTLIMAIKQYETQYGVLPAYNGIPGSAITDDIEINQDANNDGFISLLTNASTNSSTEIGNVRGIRFLDPTNPEKPNKYTDAWGRPFFIRIDTDYNGEIDCSTGGSDVHGLGGTLYTNVVIWSTGPDETSSDNSSAASNEDNVNSWD